MVGWCGAWFEIVVVGCLVWGAMGWGLIGRVEWKLEKRSAAGHGVCCLRCWDAGCGMWEVGDGAGGARQPWLVGYGWTDRAGAKETNVGNVRRASDLAI